MVTLHPGKRAELGRGPRLLVEVPRSHAGAVDLVLSPSQGLTAVRHPRGRWVIEGSPDGTGQLTVVAADGGPMSGVLSVRLALPGGTGSDTADWDLGDVLVDGRGRVDLAGVELTSDGSWAVTSLVRGSGHTRGGQAAPVRPTPPPEPSAPPSERARGVVLAGEPVETGVVVAVDRSASVHWAMEGTALAQVVAGLQTSFSRALTPDARVRWFTHGSSSSDADGPVPIATADLTAEAIARAMRPELPSSGARADSLLRAVDEGEIVICVSDRWPEPELVAAARTRGVQVAAVLLGIPPDDSVWPTDWLEQSQRCAAEGVPGLPVGDGAAAQGAVRDWGMQVVGVAESAVTRGAAG